jgi:hypothetical protein
MVAQWRLRKIHSLVDRLQRAHCFRTCLSGSLRALVAVVEVMQTAAAASVEALVGPADGAAGSAMELVVTADAAASWAAREVAASVEGGE